MRDAAPGITPRACLPLSQPGSVVQFRRAKLFAAFVARRGATAQTRRSGGGSGATREGVPCRVYLGRQLRQRRRGGTASTYRFCGGPHVIPVGNRDGGGYRGRSHAKNRCLVSDRVVFPVLPGPTRLCQNIRAGNYLAERLTPSAEDVA